MYCWIWVILFSIFCFFFVGGGGGKGGRRGGGFLTHTAREPSLWAGQSLPYTTLLQRFFHLLSAKYLLFSIPRRSFASWGAWLLARGRTGQDRAGQGIGHGRAKRRVFFFSFFFFSFLFFPIFFFFQGDFFPEGGEVFLFCLGR